MTKLVVANWKTNPKTLEEAKVLVLAEDHENVVICPPVEFLREIVLQKAKLGAQDFDIPAPELKQLGVKYVILGHSQRRLKFGETDAVINAKVVEALQLGLIPILCLGDKADEQFANCTKGLTPDALQKIIFTYEPLNAISTVENSKPISPDVANQMIEHIHQLAGENSRVLYGGTVNKDNAHEYAQYPKIDGALVGAASLNPENFLVVVSEFNRE
jgi:triosephosphate isomerase